MDMNLVLADLPERVRTVQEAKEVIVKVMDNVGEVSAEVEDKLEELYEDIYSLPGWDASEFIVEELRNKNMYPHDKLKSW